MRFFQIVWIARGIRAKNLNLKGVVDPPLQPSEGPDHDDTSAQAFGEEVAIAEVLSDLPKALSGVGGLSLQGDQGVRRVGDDRADDPSKVPRGKGNSKLSLRVMAVQKKREKTFSQ